jgi:signal transduction histidine kinase
MTEFKSLFSEVDLTEIKVKDEGLGITPEDMSKLFTPFYVTKNKESRAANPSGNGLGLSISQNIA